MNMGPTKTSAARRAALLLGIGYVLVGLLFAQPTTHVLTWRRAAWVVSAIGYASHIWYENVRLRSSPGLAALHVACAVALGAFGLAVAANVHSYFIESTDQHRSLLRLSLAIWPVITALPAYVLVLGISGILARALARVQRR
jgi:hypothetical protein